MILILKRISEDTIVADIEAFFDPALKGGWLSRSGRIHQIRIQKLSQSGIDKVEYNALVDVRPDSVAKRAVKQLNRKPVNHKPVNVGFFAERNLGNDRRVSRYSKSDDRRKADRRRQQLQIIDITAQRRIAEIKRSGGSWTTDVTL